MTPDRRRRRRQYRFRQLPAAVRKAFPLTTDPSAVLANIRPFVEREHDFYGVKMALPAEFEIVHADGSHVAL